MDEIVWLQLSSRKIQSKSNHSKTICSKNPNPRSSEDWINLESKYDWKTAGFLVSFFCFCFHFFIFSFFPRQNKQSAMEVLKLNKKSFQKCRLVFSNGHKFTEISLTFDWLKQRDRETERQRNRETERQRDRETERQRDRETERHRKRKMKC